MINHTKLHYELTRKCTDISEIMLPLLSKHGVTIFNYYKWYFDGRVIRLSANDRLTEHFFKNDYLNKITVPNSYLMKPINYFIWQINDCPEVLLDYRNNFDMGDGLTIATRNADSIEYYAFAATANNHSIINNFYINNLDLLLNYCHHFKDQAKPIIAECEKNKITLLNPEKSKELIIPRSASTQLTDRQYMCANLLLKGMKYKEIGKELNLSPRTVETHIEYLKNKLKCRTKTELIVKLSHILKNEYLL